jgi:mannosyltransferase OCH1-like enzyme
MRNEGGLYLDLDRFYNIPMDQILDHNVSCFLPTLGDFDFSHDIMLSAPGHELFHTVIDLNLQRRAAGSTNIYYLGPQTYMNGITLWLTGVMIEPDPGSEVFKKLRTQITELPGFRTYKEDIPDYTLVYQYDVKTYRRGNGLDKSNFYQEFGVVHWEKI